MTTYANNKDAMRAENRRQILNDLRAGAFSRIELAHMTGLSQSAITSITSELIAAGLLVELGKQDGGAGPGRKPISLGLNERWADVVGVSIDHEGFDVGLLNLKGRLVSPAVHLSYSADPLKALDGIAAAIAGLVGQSPRILGVGVVAPGPLDSETGRILEPPTFVDWHNVNVKEGLEKRTGLPVFVRHNADALAQSELLNGCAGQYDSFALLAVNAGIGLGLVLNRRSYGGAHGFGCEIGHTSVDLNGRLCSCGNRGCLELYASTSAILNDARRLDGAVQSWEDLVDRAWAGERVCLELLEIQSHYLAQSIINLHNLLSLDAVILSGLATYRCALLLEKVNEKVQRAILSRGIRPLTITTSTVGRSPLLIAAGAGILERLFADGLLLQKLPPRPGKLPRDAAAGAETKGELTDGTM